MTPPIDQAELDNVRDVTRVIIDIVAPAILKCIAAGHPGVRDYRKEAWLVGLKSDQKLVDKDVFADAVLAAFDERFPK